MSAYIDLNGKVFGTLEVIQKEDVRNSHVYWRVRCQKCGFEKTVSSSLLSYGVGCNNCINKERWSIKYDQRIQLCKDYLDGMPNSDICEKYGISLENKALIYRVLKTHGIKPDRRNLKRRKL